MTTTKDILAYFRKLDACEPGMTWITNQLEKKPELSFEQLWKMAMIYNPRDKISPELAFQAICDRLKEQEKV